MVNLNFTYIVLYGPLLHEHPNSWFFLGLYNAFKYKRYKVFWVNFERRELLNKYNLESNCLFITDKHDEEIPLYINNFYILFNHYDIKYNGYNILKLGIYNNQIPNYCKEWKDKFYIKYSLENRELYFPLASELLPQEILMNQQRQVLTNLNEQPNIFYIGCVINNSEIYSEITRTCRKNYYNFCLCNNSDSKCRVDKIIKSLVCPIIACEEQNDNSEILGEVFQIISYGGFPTTNSLVTANLIDDMCINYSNNGRDLILKGIEKKNKVYDNMCKWMSMEYVKNNHTYLQRLEVIFWFLLRI